MKYRQDFRLLGVAPHQIVDTPEDLAKLLGEYLTMCYYGRPVIDGDTGAPILDAKGQPVVEHDEHTVPKFGAAARHCGFVSRQSLYDCEKRGGDWAEVVQNFREAVEEWFVGRGVHPRKGDNPMFMSMILQARYGYTPATRSVQSGDPDKPLAILHDTPEDVKRVLSSLKIDRTKPPNLPDK